MELTTFYGHMLAMGVTEYIEWENLTPYNIQDAVNAIHDAGGLAGIAHPFRPGNPICTGCFWEYKIYDWHQIDYMEIWTETFPSIDPVNGRAMKLWVSHLNNGEKCTAVSGKDWHGPQNDNKPYAVTYLGIDDKQELCADSVKGAIRSHRAIITLGPLMLFHIYVENDKNEYGVGDMVGSKSVGRLRAEIRFDFRARSGLWHIDSPKMKVVLFTNKGVIAESVLTTNQTELHFDFDSAGIKWVFPRLYGKLDSRNAELAFTNPIYL